MFCCGSHRYSKYCPCCGAYIARPCPCCGHINHWPLPKPQWNPPIYVGKPDINVHVTINSGRGSAAHATSRLAGVA